MTIQRDRPITVEELRQLVKDDHSLSILPDEEQEIGALLWNGEDPDLPLAFQDGTLWSTPRNDAAIGKMQDISRRLGARLIGEDGGDFTDEDFNARKPAVAERPPSCSSCCSWRAPQSSLVPSPPSFSYDEPMITVELRKRDDYDELMRKYQFLKIHALNELLKQHKVPEQARRDIAEHLMFDEGSCFDEGWIEHEGEQLRPILCFATFERSQEDGMGDITSIEAPPNPSGIHEYAGATVDEYFDDHGESVDHIVCGFD